MNNNLFYIETCFGLLDMNGDRPVSFERLHFLKVHGHRYKFNEEEADMLVAGLLALNARKVKVR
jgi:hypothetical protein